MGFFNLIYTVWLVKQYVYSIKAVTIKKVIVLKNPI